MDTTTVRRTFIDFFVNKGHTFVPSSPVVPHDDPTLLFANAGMNQFKPIFLGQVDSTSRMGQWKRAANSQKCIRAGGKHNDLDDVGKDTYHHTFFEMLGNWSFGDYFKAEAIAWAWELLVDVYRIAPDRLYATYFEGNAKLGLAPDEETRTLWRRFLPDNRIIPGNMKDNFWEMGETGPCGPCTEIHYDRIGNREAATLVNCGDPNVIEIWNNVFIQFNRIPGGALEPLPHKHVDTGMGLERLVSVLQNKLSNYDTDVFAPLFAAIEKSTGARPYSGKLGAADRGNIDTAYRVVADHIRTLTFALTDGAMPGNVGRGYVLRRILRRAVRYGRQMLNAPDGFFSGLVPVVVANFKEAFPELATNPDRVADIIREEEESFGRTLDRGLKLFAKLTEGMEIGGTIPGSEAFKLYDTYGFPIDLTALMAEERALKVDMDGFRAEIEAQKERGRAAMVAAFAGADGKKIDLTGIAATQFVGYDEMASTAKVLKVVTEGDTVVVITDKTPFYAASGGQVGDRGTIVGPAGTLQVATTDKAESVWLHVGELTGGALEVGDTVTLTVDRRSRRATMRHHTTTHILHKVLRDVLGEHVHQAGSLVAPERLRFDFTHNKAIGDEQLREIEARVNAVLLDGLPVAVRETTYDDAVRAGAMALFGEKYGDRVRMISVGEFSKELCGGTHLHNAAEAGLFKILSEASIAAGVRRIEAVTGEAAMQYVAQREHTVAAAAARLGCPGDEVPNRLDKLLAEVEGLKKELYENRKKQLRTTLERLRNEKRQIAGANAFIARLDGVSVDELKELADDLVGGLPATVAVLASTGDKIGFVMKVSADLVQRGVHAGNVLKELAKITGGGGGGRPEMATAGGKDVSRLPEALHQAEHLLAGKLNG